MRRGRISRQRDSSRVTRRTDRPTSAGFRPELYCGRTKLDAAVARQEYITEQQQ